MPFYRGLFLILLAGACIPLSEATAKKFGCPEFLFAADAHPLAAMQLAFYLPNLQPVLQPNERIEVWSKSIEGRRRLTVVWIEGASPGRAKKLLRRAQRRPERFVSSSFAGVVERSTPVRKNSLTGVFASAVTIVTVTPALTYAVFGWDPTALIFSSIASSALAAVVSGFGVQSVLGPEPAGEITYRFDRLEQGLRDLELRAEEATSSDAELLGVLAVDSPSPSLRGDILDTLESAHFQRFASVSPESHFIEDLMSVPD